MIENKLIKILGVFVDNTSAGFSIEQKMSLQVIKKEVIKQNKYFL